MNLPSPERFWLMASVISTIGSLVTGVGLLYNFSDTKMLIFLGLLTVGVVSWGKVTRLWKGN